MKIFDKAFDFVLEIEGGYTNHKDDHGGATNWGITIEDLSLWRKKQVSIDDVKGLSKDEAKNIYLKRYWMPLRLGGFNALTATVLFDQGINRGVRQVATEVQRILGVKQDGIIGVATLSAVERFNDKELAYELVKVAQSYYAKIVIKNPTQLVFLNGWINRSHRLLDLIYKT